MNNDQTISAGLAFIQAAYAASATAGDKERVLALRDAMQFALRERLQFMVEDAAALLAMRIESREGDFRPLDYYKEACLRGRSSYTEMWEAHNKVNPWVAQWAIASDHPLRDYFILENNRVAVGMGVLFPAEVDTPDPATLSVSGMQVWWVMGLSDDFVRVCRYRLTPEELANRHRDTPFLHHSRSPSRVRIMTREEWTELNAERTEEMKAA